MFKVGDRVRYVKHDVEEVDSKYYDIGNIYTILDDSNGFVLNHTKGEEKNMFVYSDQIEHIESAKTGTGMTVTPILHTNYTLVIKDQKINLTKSELYDLMEVVKGELNEG